MSLRTPSIYSQDDPLAQALQPSPSESEVERKTRLMRESEARRVSEQIDEEIRREKEKLKKYKEDVKLLLLGQAESGKSTFQKQFKLMYKPHVLESERVSWRTVIYFNVICAIKHIIMTMDTSHDAEPSSGTRTPRETSSTPDIASLSDQNLPGRLTPTRQAPTPESYQIANLRLRLSPLVAAESSMAELLSDGTAVTHTGLANIFVRSDWQTRGFALPFKGKRTRAPSSNPQDKNGDRSAVPLVEEVANMLDACKEDIQSLWQHHSVKAALVSRRLRMEDWATYCLDNIMRIATPDYIPSTDDILHARIRTMGVTEDTFEVNIHGKLVTWRIYDVGGARGQRHAWAPYFDDVNVIIFVAPVSAFDQYLEEDPQVNRIDDSLQLFTQICTNPLLKAIHLVLFLNKTDILQAKLDAGVRVKKYITSFGDRPNDYETVSQYFRAHFLQVHRKSNEKRRVLYTHFTSVINTKATQSLIRNVRDSIFRGYLQSASLV